MCGAFIVENFQPIGISQHVFSDEDTPETGFSLHKEIAHEVFFNIDILMIQFAEGFLVNVIPHTHKGKLEKARHGRGKTVGSALRECPYPAERRARPARPEYSSPARGGSFHAAAAVCAVNGLMGSCATSPASFSENNILRIPNSMSEAGAP